MAADSERLADTRAWLVKASLDLRGAEIDLAADPPLPEDALFHCQQAVEKALKGFLSWHDREFRKTHSLEELGEACLAIDDSLRSLVDRAVPLTEYAWSFRYPGDVPEPDASEAAAAHTLAREVVRAVRVRIPALGD